MSILIEAAKAVDVAKLPSESRQSGFEKAIDLLATAQGVGQPAPAAGGSVCCG